MPICKDVQIGKVLKLNVSFMSRLTDQAKKDSVA